VHVLEALQVDRRAEVLRDPVVRARVGLAAHVRREAAALAPAADHPDVLGIAIGAPDLQVDEPVRAVDEVTAPAEGLDELVRPGSVDTKS
jgi:hypothetical protein